MANPIYRVPSSLFIDTSSDKVTIQKDAVAASLSSIGLSLSNVTAGASNAPQFSPVLETIGAGYTGSVSATNKYGLQAQSVSGTWAANARSGDGYLAVLPSYNAASYTTPGWLLDTAGNLQAKGFVLYNGTTAQVPLKSPWIDFTFTNSFSNVGSPYYNCQYFKDAFGVVHFRGAFKGSGAGGSAVAFTMPAGYRPAAIVDFCIATNTAFTTFGGLQWPVNGALSTSNANTFLLLDGMSYTAEG